MSTLFLTALPVYNEAHYVCGVLDQVRRFSDNVLVVDDGSTDGTAELLAARDDIHLITHPTNRGYGAALKTAFRFAVGKKFDILGPIDCDGQHQPGRIPYLASPCRSVDIVSGSRYLKQFPGDSLPPPLRRWINRQVTAEINRRLGLHLTDAFCGFKAYRVAALQSLMLTEPGYAMPLQLWVEAAHAGMKIVEHPVPLIYLDEQRSFGGVLDDAATRLEYYHLVLDRAIAALSSREGRIPDHLLCKEGAGCG